MSYRRLISSVIIIFIIAISVMGGPGCANIIPPQGGPRDSIPPVLLKATPGDSTRNFTGNKITFTFDEFVDIQGIQENLMVSPSPLINPSVDFRLNTVTVKLKDTLEPNTTYSIHFGDAIKDYTEGNPLKGFRYTFSTGRYIDSLELSGKVILAENGKIDTTLIVMLHTSANDSAVVNQRPRYVSKLDGNGNFIFKNLPPKTFYLYALQDDGGTRRYFSDKQLFAFADKPVVVDGTTDPVTLYAYAVKPPVQQAASPVLSMGNRINKGAGNTADNRLRYQTNLTSNQQDLLGNFIMTFEQPLRIFDSTKIRLYTDSTFTALAAYTFQKDTTNKRIQLVHDWKENATYSLILDKDFAQDSAGKKLLKTDTLRFRTMKLADYGSLKLKIRNLDMARHPVLFIMSGESIYKSIPLGSPDFSQTLFPPGEYELRILYDENKNGTWDPGQFFGKHKQPELVKPIERKITVKSAWQNEFEIAL
ncbi:MAG: Ig-like domain-containing protein [Ferruginibacter sp.]|nr:Ig-like domain-containing protein [Chitinophagaceae bacterium]